MINEYKVDKIAGFIYKALECGYSYDEAWALLISSPSGEKILSNTYSYVYHIQGATSFYYAMEKSKPAKTPNQVPSLNEVELLAEFIEFAHEHNISYDKMFEKESLKSFMDSCGSVLGNYDEKLLGRLT